MLLPWKYAGRWCRKEWRQGRHLRRHLLRSRQKTFRRGIDGLPPLRGEAKGLLNAHNGFARATWFRALAGNLCQEIGAKPPRFVPPETVYLLTVIDRRQLVYPDSYGEDGFNSLTLAEIRRSYADLLQGLNYIGMLDPALFVSTQRTHGVKRFFCYHVHALLWGLSQDELAEFLERTRAKIKALLPYATPVDATPIRAGTLLRVISYVAKMPRKQYQLWERTNTGSYQQWDRDLNGVNAVRLYGAMKDCTLDGLVLSGGAGDRVLKRIHRDLHDWRLEHSTLELPPPERFSRI